MAPQPPSPEPRFEPCASTASLFLYAQGSSIVCLHHDTLAIDRRFQHHQDEICFISVDNVSERGAGRLVVSYDFGQTAIVWDLFTGTEIARFASFEHLRVASWMRNGNVAFGNGKGDVILFEPSTSEHRSARTIFDPVTALAPATDCRTYAIGYQNGSILIANLHPTFTILHTLSTSRGPSPILSISWHASSSKQKSDMLATLSSNGDLRVWSVAKPAGKEAPRVIRVLKRSDGNSPGPKWIAWSKNGRILQYLDGETWAWDVRTKHVTYEPIPTIENVRGIANYGPTATLFTLGPQHTVQQYDVESPAMVANIQHCPADHPAEPSRDAHIRPTSPAALQAPVELATSAASRRTPFGTEVLDAARQQRADTESPVSMRSHSNSVSSKASSDKYRPTPFSPPSRSAQSGTTFSLTPVAGRETPQPFGSSLAYASSVSVSSTKSSRAGSRLRNEVQFSPGDTQPIDLFPFARARLNDVPYKPHHPIDETRLTPDDLRRQMLSVVFGWDGDIEDLIKDELSRHSVGSPSAILLARWLGESDTDQMVSMISSGPTSALDWMLLALSQMTGHQQANQVGEAFVQKLLERGDVHSSATILLALGDRNDAIEVYVSRKYFMEAILMTCLLMPADWQRQSYLVRQWGEYVVSHSQQQLAIRCFMCTGVEPSEPWISPSAQHVTSFQELLSRSPVASLGPSFSQTTSNIPPLNQLEPPVNNRPVGKTPALKLITSFDTPPSRNFKYPGLKSDDRTPTNAPGVTPIAESAACESAMSPGGFGSYRLNNVQSLNLAMSGRTGTPVLSRPRLASIGETPVDVMPPSFPPKEPNSHHFITDCNHRRAGSQDSKSEGLLTLLPSARYEPDSAAQRPSPQTAVQTGLDKFAPFNGPPSPVVGVFEAIREHPRGRNGSNDRKPDGLHIHLPVNGSNRTSTNDPSSPLVDPADLFVHTRSPASTLNSYRSTKSPSISGRSTDQYISSLDESRFYTQKHSDRRHADDNSRQHHHRSQHQDARGRHEHRYIPPAKRSPSSPVPMSPEELVRINTAANDAENARKAKSRNRDGSKLQKGDSRTRTPSERRRNRSTSRNAASRPRPKNDLSARGRSIDREGSSARSPSSPLPMSPVGRDAEGALRLVASDRERLRSRQRSSSRRPDRVGSTRRDRSPDTRRPGITSSSHQASGDNGLSFYEGTPLDEKPKTSSDEDGRSRDSRSSAPPVSLAEKRRRELAAAELEARRLSLARNPSAPNIPLPGEPHLSKSPIEGPSNPFSSLGQRSQARHKGGPARSSPEYPSSSDSNSTHSAAPVGLPATPRAMRHPKYSNGYEEEETPQVPNISENPYFLTDARHTRDFERIGRSMSVPMPELQPPVPVPADLPHHPRFNPSLPRSRSSSRTRNNTGGSHRRNGSYDPGSHNAYPRHASPPVTVSIDETMDGSTAQRRPVVTMEHPPILPELQHLNTPPPPPPAPISINGVSPQESTGTIDIAFENNEHAGKLLTRAMTAAPIISTEKRPSLDGSRRMSFDHRRGRSVNESWSSKIRNFTDRMRSTSRGAVPRSLDTEQQRLPYESVPAFDNRI